MRDIWRISFKQIPVSSSHLRTRVWNGTCPRAPHEAPYIHLERRRSLFIGCIFRSSGSSSKSRTFFVNYQKVRDVEVKLMGLGGGAVEAPRKLQEASSK
jgi:hypothetical protein